MQEEASGVEMWIDGQGKEVIIKTIFSKVYIDEKVRELNEKYDIWKCDGERRSNLEWPEMDGLVAKILVLVRVSGDRSISLVGVKKLELWQLAERSGGGWCIGLLIQNGYLREKWIKGDLVVFPTEKLLENQKIGKRRAPQPQEQEAV